MADRYRVGSIDLCHIFDGNKAIAKASDPETAQKIAYALNRAEKGRKRQLY